MSARTFITQGSIQAAFIAISSRLVGSAFRFLETLNPQFQKTKVISDPSTVFIREVVTISMAWGFALLTNIAIKPLAHRKRWGNFGVQMVTAVVGTTIAESIGRFIAYRKALQKENIREMPKHQTLPSISMLKTPPINAVPVHLSKFINATKNHIPPRALQYPPYLSSSVYLYPSLPTYAWPYR